MTLVKQVFTMNRTLLNKASDINYAGLFFQACEVWDSSQLYRILFLLYNKTYCCYEGCNNYQPLKNLLVYFLDEIYT